MHSFPITPQPSTNTTRPRRHFATGSQESGVVDVEDGYEKTNGHTNLNGKVNGINGTTGMDERERRRVRDAEEFELDALISDEEDEERGAGRKEATTRV